MKEKLFSDTTFILAFLTSSAYVLGVTYCQGFFREFGLDDTQFLLPFDRYLFQGFVSFRYIGPPTMFMLTLVLLCITLTIFIYLFARESRRRKSTRKNKQDEISKGNSLDGESWTNFWVDALFLGGVLFGSFFCILIVAVFSADAGAKAAINFKNKMDAGEVSKTLVNMKLPEKNFSGYSIMCNQSQCAYFVNGTSKIVNFSDVESLEVVIK